MALIDTYSDPMLEKQLLAALFQGGDEVVDHLEKLFPTHFADESLRRVFLYVKQCAIRTGKVPDEETLRIALLEKFPRAKETSQSIIETFSSIKATTVSSTLPFLLEKVINFSRARDMLVSMERSVRFLEEGKVDDALKNYQDDALSLQSIDPNAIVVTGEMTEDFENRVRLYEDKRLHPEKYRGVSTGIDDLDRLTGGLWKGELGFVFGKSGVGKSFCLLAFAFTAFTLGLKVLVIPIEMPYHQWAARYDSRVTHIEYSRFKWGNLSEQQFKQWRDRHEQMKRLYYDKGGRLYISHIPLGCNMWSIRSQLEKFSRLSNQIDVLILDYADLVTPPRQLPSEQSELTAVFRELKGYAQLYNIPIWTATQMKRDSYHKDVVDMTDIGFAAGKAHVSDLVIGITRTDSDVLRGIMKLHIVKYRDGIHNVPIILKPNLALAAIDMAGIA